MTQPSNKLKPVIWVDTTDAFTEYANRWLECEFLAIDTEFERRTTYFPILALVQIFDGENVYLIDPLKLTCPDVFRSICANDKIIKIMHSSKEDLEVFYHSWKCQLHGLFDTQIANAFIHGEISLGYASLVEKTSQTQLDKQETQSNWLARPLQQAQLDYAAADVLYLPQIYQTLAPLLEDKVACIFWKECQQFCQQVTEQPDFDSDYRQAKDVWQLKGEQIPLFKSLYQWRENTAIEQDRTRNHIAKDHQLVEMVIMKPTSKTALSKISGLHPRTVRQYHEKITSLISRFKLPENMAEFQKNSSDHLVTKAIPNPREVSSLKKLSENFTKQVDHVAQSLGVASSVVASKRFIRKVAFAYLTEEPFPKQWCGWRKEYLKPHFDSAYAQLPI